MVQGSEFGQEALSKASDVIEQARGAIESKDLDTLVPTIETLRRTQKMFKGVLARA